MTLAAGTRLGPYEILAPIGAVVGEPEKALDSLELLLKTPYRLSPGWLRNSRFQKLVH